VEEPAQNPGAPERHGLMLQFSRKPTVEGSDKGIPDFNLAFRE
jgi:hypothetical protein